MPTELDLSYKRRFQDAKIPEAYEALILDALKGDHSNCQSQFLLPLLFFTDRDVIAVVRDDELDAAWKVRALAPPRHARLTDPSPAPRSSPQFCTGSRAATGRRPSPLPTRTARAALRKSCVPPLSPSSSVPHARMMLTRSDGCTGRVHRELRLQAKPGRLLVAPDQRPSTPLSALSRSAVADADSLLADGQPLNAIPPLPPTPRRRAARPWSVFHHSYKQDSCGSSSPHPTHRLPTPSHASPRHCLDLPPPPSTSLLLLLHSTVPPHLALEVDPFPCPSSF